MARIYNSLIELVGNTPLLSADRLVQRLGLKSRMLLKLESWNPLSSVKDRAALAMVEAAERTGSLRPGGVIVEASSGNTGVAISFIARIKGYRCVVVMPESMSLERRNLIKALGAELVLSPAAEGMKGALRIAQGLLAETPGAVSLGQFDNAANPRQHEATTAQEIWADTDGAVDIVVAGVGTGGTVTGVARGLKAHKPAVRIVAVEPENSPVLSGGTHTPHMIQGIGAGFVPTNYDAALVDEILAVSNDAAIEAARLLAETEGVLSGFSGGAALDAAICMARRPESRGKTIVAILPDTGERYLSTVLYQRD